MRPPIRTPNLLRYARLFYASLTGDVTTANRMAGEIGYEIALRTRERLRNENGAAPRESGADEESKKGLLISSQSETSSSER